MISVLNELNTSPLGETIMCWWLLCNKVLLAHWQPACVLIFPLNFEVIEQKVDHESSFSSLCQQTKTTQEQQYSDIFPFRGNNQVYW